MSEPCTREYAHTPHWYPKVGLPVRVHCPGRRRFAWRTIWFSIKTIWWTLTGGG